MLYQQSATSEIRTLASSAPGPGAWAQHAIAAYKRLVEERTSGLQAQLASLLLSLTGHQVMPGPIWADGAGRTAVAKLDGHTFRLGDGKLSLLRPCNYCGVSQFESPGIRTVEDLGWALSWEPCCEGCEPDDEDWSYSW